MNFLTDKYNRVVIKSMLDFSNDLKDINDTIGKANAEDIMRQIMVLGSVAILNIRDKKIATQDEVLQLANEKGFVYIKQEVEKILNTYDEKEVTLTLEFLKEELNSNIAREFCV